jgi:hypothetical protein
MLFPLAALLLHLFLTLWPGVESVLAPHPMVFPDSEEKKVGQCFLELLVVGFFTFLWHYFFYFCPVPVLSGYVHCWPGASCSSLAGVAPFEVLVQLLRAVRVALSQAGLGQLLALIIRLIYFLKIRAHLVLFKLDSR